VAAVGAFLLFVPWLRPLSFTTTTWLGAVGMRGLFYASTALGVSLIAGASFTIGLNIPSLFYNPSEAKTMNDKWLIDFENKFPNPTDSKVIKAKATLSQILDYASNKMSVYSVLRTLDSVLGSGIPSSPCGDWSEEVWKEAKMIAQNDPETLAALQALNIDLCVNEWKSTASEAHYTVGIRIGEDKWEIDNGYAWLSIPWDSYRVGVPFLRTQYDSDGTKFQKVDPQCQSIYDN
jgi:hypothetical protein